MRILVADPSATVREGAQRALSEAGHEVSLAATGLQAWHSALELRPDVAFVSLDFPDLDGLELLSLWRGLPQGQWPVVMLVDPPAVAGLALWSSLAGPTWQPPDVLRRPFPPALLCDVLEALVP